jgi:hypothetical protein
MPRDVLQHWRYGFEIFLKATIFRTFEELDKGILS